MTQIKKAYVDTQDGQVHYRICAGGSGEPIVLVHMTSSASDSYDALMTALAGRHTTIACDTPNYGQSYRTDMDPSIEYIASVWLEALDAIGVDRFHVLGHHTGASVASEMAVQAPERVLSATLSGFVYTTAEENAHLMATYVHEVPITDYGTQFMWAWTRTMATMDGKDLPAAYKHRETVGTLVAGERWNWAYKAVFTYNPTESVHRVRCPIFLATGELDRVAVIFHNRAADALPHAKVLTVPDRGIDYMDTYAEEFAPELAAFIDGL